MNRLTATALSLGVLVGLAHGGTLAFDYSGSGTGVTNWMSAGYSFTVGSGGVTVDSFLIYETGPVGPSVDTLVSIFPNDGSNTPVNGLQVNFTVDNPQWTVRDENGKRWLEMDVADTVLAEGTYHLILTSENVSVQRNVTGMSTAANITYGSPLLAWTTNTPNPTSDAFGSTTGYFGPNFSVVVPEPGTMGLLAVGVAALLRRRRK